MAKSSRIRTKGRIKKKISEWDFFWEKNKDKLATPVSWHDAIPEVLHIAISLQKNEPQEILESLFKIRDRVKTLFGTEWNGNLSTLFQYIQQYPELLEVIKMTKINESIICLLVTYNKLFNSRVPKGDHFSDSIVFQAYFDINERNKDLSILCKYVLCKFLDGDRINPFGLFNAITRQEILAYPSRVTTTWVVISQNYEVVDSAYSRFIWDYNIRYLPFIVQKDKIVANREYKNFKKNNMNLLKAKIDGLFLEFKKIELSNYFERYVAEVFMGFISRIHYLSMKIIEQEERHEGEIAECTLRLLYETRIKFLWLNKVQDIKMVAQFREYKVGREKLFLDFFKEKGRDDVNFKEPIEQLNALFDRYKQSEGIDDYKVAIEKGDAFEKSVKDMADALGEYEANMYFIIYKRTSDVVHSNWRIVENYHLERSLNPAQNGALRYKSSQNTYAGLLPSYLGLLLSTSSLLKFFEFYPPFLKENRVVYNSLKKFYNLVNKKYKKEFA